VEAKLRPLLEAVVAPVSARPREACVSGRHTLQAGQEHCGVCPREALRCPGCARRMRLHALHGVTVDVCTGCPAVWLDAGELAKLRQALVPLSERVRKAGDAAAEAVSDAVTDALTDGVTDALYEPRRSVRALVVLFRVLLGRRW
jgi:Zn-finger nucleic acid-binding protein